MFLRLEDHEPFTAHFGPMEDFRRRFEHVFEERARERKPARAAAPLFTDRGDGIELTAALPGVAGPEGHRPHRQERGVLRLTLGKSAAVRPRQIPATSR